MKELVIRIDELIEKLAGYIAESPNAELSHKPQIDKWSKKEIVGHLIDSAINNLKRFTDILASDQTYIVSTYPQG